MKAHEFELDFTFQGRPESIYKLARRIKKTQNSLYNALRSIFEDSLFVEEIRALWPQLPLLANLRCGLWYSSHFDASCYFKSTDGHTGNCSFSSTRLNLHVASLAAKGGGCMIIDATRKGKRFPDSMSKTIPIWACVINRAVADRRVALQLSGSHIADSATELSNCEDWDCSLHLPAWVSKTEKSSIECRIDDWVQRLKNSGADLSFLFQTLKKPLQPLWISQQSLIWLNEVPEASSWHFTPIILVSASHPKSSQLRVTTEGSSWQYIPGAADDEESWARGLTPALFWKHAYNIMGAGGPEECKRKVWEVVEKDRVNRAAHGLNAPQIRIKSKTRDNQDSEATGMGNIPLHVANVCTFGSVLSEFKQLQNPMYQADCKSMQVVNFPMTNSNERIHWISTTGLAIGSVQSGLGKTSHKAVDCIVNCESTSFVADPSSNYNLNLNITGSKFDRHSLENHLPAAISFAKEKLTEQKTILILCHDGEDISVCVCLGVLLSCFNPTGNLGFEKTEFPMYSIGKSDVRKALVFISSFHSAARPSRGNLKQVYSYLSTHQLEQKIS